ncbi:MAG: DUF1592 domain-containing protein [Verrucomicrobiales bacterium]|nr:DUF1592 domain-containing protein [Verrucomicrobiales bacterium]
MSRVSRINQPSFFLFLSGLGIGLASAEIPDGPEGYNSHIKPFFEAYCIQCHGPDKSKGKMTLHTLDGDLSNEKKLNQWEDILDVLKLEEMPPEEESQPKVDERNALIQWIDKRLRLSAGQTGKAPDHPTARRLTNFEYENTMRDLFGIDLDLSEFLPEDPQKPYHFNNTSEFMLLGPEQIDRYLNNARRTLASAIVDPEKPEVIRHQWHFEGGGSPLSGQNNDEVGIHGGGRYSVSRGIKFKTWPETGEYRIRIRAAAILPPGYDEVPLTILMGTHLRSDAGTGDYFPVGSVSLRNKVDDVREFEFRGRIENHPIHVGKVTRNGQEPDERYIYVKNGFDDGRLQDYFGSSRGKWQWDLPRAVVKSVEFEAPVVDVWPPEHHTRILLESPLRETNPDAYVRMVLRKFMNRAFRRPASDGEVERFHKLYRMLEPEFGTLEATMRETLSMILISHQFLFHTQGVEGLVSSQHELANRLSYFLWGSMPDEELLALAEQNQLNDPAVVEAQVERLLADQRSRDFVDNFTTQWLSLEKMKAVNINLQLFPRFLYTVTRGERTGQEIRFRPTVRDYLHEETIGFISELIRTNASMMQIIDSNFAWINEPLAEHYGIDGVKGIAFRAVPLAEKHRIGGLPTHASVLIGNGTGSAPHPIYRAVWLREAILGDEVRPPPAEVPALSDSAGDSADKAVTIKDLLALHRQQESCNDCHIRLDPWGIPFEQYNAVGQYQPLVPKEGTRVSGFRDEVHKDLNGYVEYLKTIHTVKVDASARVPHGPQIDGMKELKTFLLEERSDDIAANVIRRLLTYGLGRELTYRDRYAVQDLLEQARGINYSFRDTIVAICQSDIFLQPTTSP